MNYNTLNVLALAYIGDSIYEVYIRNYLLKKGIIKVDQLQKESTKFVSAKSQAKYLTKILENNILTEDEIKIIFRARNHKGNRHPKNTDIITYKKATGLEALIGFLYLKDEKERINKIMDFILEDNYVHIW